MKRRKSVLIAFGTRPEAVKMAPVLNALEADKAFEVEALSTAQHREMLDQTAAAFNLRIDHDLNLMRDRQTLDGLTARILPPRPPCWSSRARRSARARRRPPLLSRWLSRRSTDRSPWARGGGPAIGKPVLPLSRGDEPSSYLKPLHLHYAPTEGNRANLLAQGVDPDSIRVTGNTVIDALLETVALPTARGAGSRSGRFRRIARLRVDVPSAREPGRTDGAHVRCSTRHGRRPR